MALTSFQRRVCRLLAQQRLEDGERYMAGGAALNEVLRAARVSRDIDLFHDTERAVLDSWEGDRRLLENAGLQVRPVRERPSYVEAEVAGGSEAVRIEWTRDSAFRFFPLVEHAELGLTLHPFDLATNKVLALVGRAEVRDWVDAVHCAEQLQPLGYLAWAACGKDPGFSAAAILNEAARSGRYSYEEVAELHFAGEAPDAGDLSRRWKRLLHEGRQTIEALPPDTMGSCVLTRTGDLFTGDAEKAARAADRGELLFHAARLRGAFPKVSPA